MDWSHECSLRVVGRRSGLFLLIIPFALLNVVRHYAPCFSMNFENSMYLALRQSTFTIICVAFNHNFFHLSGHVNVFRMFVIANFCRSLLFEFCIKEWTSNFNAFCALLLLIRNIKGVKGHNTRQKIEPVTCCASCSIEKFLKRPLWLCDERSCPVDKF